MKRIPLGQLGKAIGAWAGKVEFLEIEAKKAMMRRMMRNAVDTSPVLEGKYRASHLASRKKPMGAQLADAPAYPSPGDLEVDRALAGLRFGESVYLSNDAASTKGYVYSRHAEDWGWGGNKDKKVAPKTPPYEVYKKTLEKLGEWWPEALKEGIAAAKRKTAA